MTKNTDHCCAFMEKLIDDPRVGVKYNPIFRDYTINLISSHGVQSIYNCPWCGSQLPDCLDEAYEKVLQKEYGIDDPYDDEQETHIPEEFKSDAWWKKRCL